MRYTASSGIEGSNPSRSVFPYRIRDIGAGYGRRFLQLGQHRGEALRDERTCACLKIVETENPRFGTIGQRRSPVRVGATQPEYARSTFRDEPRDQALGGVLGYDGGRIEKLRTGGAFGPDVPETPG